MTLPEGYSFRRATSADGDAVRALIFSVLEEYGLTPEPDHADRGLADIDSAFANGFLDLVLNPMGELVGTVGLLKMNEQVAELTKMFLAPSYRGKGLGHAMLRRALEAAKEGGFKQIELETDTALKEAIGLYARYGFTQIDKPNHTQRCNRVMVLTL